MNNNGMILNPTEEEIKKHKLIKVDDAVKTMGRRQRRHMQRQMAKLQRRLELQIARARDTNKSTADNTEAITDGVCE